MRAVVQRVARASVAVDGQTVSEIGRGFLVLLGVGRRDTPPDAEWIADKIVGLRLFENELGKFDRTLADVGGRVLLVSQFTLYGDARRGRRPSFTEAAAPERAEALYLCVAEKIEARGVATGRGRFGAHMQVDLVNDGPVTLLLESPAGPSE